MHNIYIKREGGREWYTPGWVFPCTSITRAKQPKSTRKISMVYSVHLSQKKKVRPLQRYLTAAHMFKLKLSKDLFHLHDQVPFPILIITFSSFYLNSPCIYDINTPVKGICAISEAHTVLELNFLSQLQLHELSESLLVIFSLQKRRLWLIHDRNIQHQSFSPLAVWTLKTRSWPS